MAADITYHYPPDLFQLMIDAVPRLCRSKKDLMLFFQGAGVGDEILADQWQVVRTNRDSVNKFDITRTVLTRLNDRGEGALRERRELLKRVVEFEKFSTCWPNQQAEAKGYVSDIRQLVEAKDSFARMRQERDRERQAHILQREAQVAKLQEQKAAREAARQQLYGLFKDDLDPHERGRDFEAVLNELFQLDGILLREPFRRQQENGQTLEQTDGVVEIASHLYLIEVKWYKKAIGVPEVQELLGKIFLRPESSARGIFISANHFTEPAIRLAQQAASKRVLVLCSLAEIVQALEREENLGRFFKDKADRTIMELRSAG